MNNLSNIGSLSATVSNIDLDPTVELEQTNLNPAHLEEWVTGSGVHPGIVELNVQSLTHQEDIFAFLYPNARRLNSGRLCTQDLRRFENCADSSGWVVTGISPETWERDTSWGRIKFDPGSLAASCDYDGKTAKYKSPAAGKGSSKIILLDVPYLRDLQLNTIPIIWLLLREINSTAGILFLRKSLIWEAIATKYNVEIDDDNFWRWVANHPEIPIYITEGEKKAGAGLTQGFVTIGLPGCWMGTQKINGVHHLHPYLEPFMHPEREIILIPDNDPNPEVKKDVCKAFGVLGRTMRNRVQSIKVIQLPDSHQKIGLDDYLVGGGSMDNPAERAMLLAQWERLVQQAGLGNFRDYLCDKYFNRILFIGELSSWYAYEKGHDSKPGVWGQVSDHSIRALVQQEMTKQEERVTANSVSNLVKVFQYDERIYRNHFPKTPDHWTPFSNCILNRKTKQIIEHHPENFLLWSLPRQYNPTAEDWSGIYNWLMFKNGGDKTLTEIDIAYCFAVLNLDVAKLQRTYLGIGEPGAGKGTMQLLWEKLVGEENILSTTLDRWCNNRFEPARAWGKRLILFDDADKVKGDLQTYKSVTGGSRIPYELKGKNTQQANFLFTGMIGTFANYDPFTLKRDDAGALARRHIPMPYNHPVPMGQQKDMGAIFENYLDGFINHLLQWNESDVEKILKGSHNNTNVCSLKWEQRYDSDFVFAAINDLFIFDTTASIEVGAKSYDPYAKSHKQAYPAVLNYLEEHGYWSGKGKPPVSGNHFSRKVVAISKEMGYKVTAQKSGHKNTSCLFGLRLRQPQDLELTFLETLENQNVEVKNQKAARTTETTIPYRKTDPDIPSQKAGIPSQNAARTTEATILYRKTDPDIPSQKAARTTSATTPDKNPNAEIIYPNEEGITDVANPYRKPDAEVIHPKSEGPKKAPTPYGEPDPEILSSKAEINHPNDQKMAEVANPYREKDAEVAEVEIEKSQSSSEEKNNFSAESQFSQTQASDLSSEEKNNISTESQLDETQASDPSREEKNNISTESQLDETQASDLSREEKNNISTESQLDETQAMDLSREEKNNISTESQLDETQASDLSREEKNNLATESQLDETQAMEAASTSLNSTFDSGPINPETPSPEEKISDAATGGEVQSDSTAATSGLPAQQGVTDSASMSAAEKTTSANSEFTSASVPFEDLKLNDLVFDQEGRMHQLVEKCPTHWKTNQNHDVSRIDWQQGKYHSPTVNDVANLINRIESVKQLKWVVANLNELMQMAISQNLISTQKLEAIYNQT